MLSRVNKKTDRYPEHVQKDSGYPHDGRADKNPYPHDRRADKHSYLHDSNNQCIILRLQLSFVMINEQMILLVQLISFYSLIFARICNKYVLLLLLFIFVHIIMLKILK